MLIRECHRLQALYCGEGMKALNDGHASARGSFDNIYMNGQEVFKFAVRAVPTVRPPHACLGFLRKILYLRKNP